MHKYNAGNQRKNIRLDRTYNKRARDEKCFKNFVGKPDGMNGGKKYNEISVEYNAHSQLNA
jgi:hypothetical protein